MAITLQDMKTNKVPEPPRILCHGMPGVGKTWFGTDAPKPVFMLTEAGLGERAGDTMHFPLVKTMGDAEDIIAALLSEDHDRRTLVIDTADWLDHILVEEMNAQHSAKELGYGRSVLLTSERWRQLLAKLDGLRHERSMAIVLLAHSQVKKFEAPDSESYDQYIPKLSKAGTALLQEWCDAILFANQPAILLEEKAGFGGKRNRAVAGGNILHTTPAAAYTAKNRYNLPDQIPFGRGAPNPWTIIGAGVAGKFRGVDHNAAPVFVDESVELVEENPDAAAA